MAIFIVANRETELQNGKLRFKNTPKTKALHDFRVAEFNSKKNDYKIIADLNEYGYEGVANKRSARSLTGTAYMFNRIFRANTKSVFSDVLVFIHGFNYSFDDNLEQIQKLEKLYMGKDSNIKHMVYISWPSRGSLFSYKSDQPDARETGRVLARLFEKLRRFFIDTFDRNNIEPCRNLIHLAAHSMGNQVLYYMLKQLDESQQMPLFSEVLLLHADAPHDGFEPGQPFTMLEKISERTHVYIHKSDDALWISDNIKGNSKRLGRRGPSDPDLLPPETFVVDCQDVCEVLDDASIIDSLKERLIDHYGYLTRPTVIADIKAVLVGVEEDEIYLREPLEHKGYYRLYDPEDIDD